MLRRLLLPFLAGLAAATPAAAAYAAAVDPAPPVPAPCLQFYLERQAPAPAAPPPADERIFCHSFYAISYSSARRDPVWTSYLLTRTMVRGADSIDRRGRTFRQQAGLAAGQQGNHHDYVHPPFDRGHMTPDNDAPNRATQADTYVVTNIVPQISGFNGGLWAQLEGAVHRLAASEREVYIVTGPLFEEARDPMNGIAVPSAIFKAIYVPSRRFALAFVSTNENPTHCTIVAIAELQRRAGLDPFPSLTAAAKAAVPAMPVGFGGFPSRCRRAP